MRSFAVYPASFDGSTLGWWRFGERGGLLTDIVAGKVLTNFGAQPLDDGYRFVRADNDYMTAPFAGQPIRSELTLECWVRDFFQTPLVAWSYRQVLQFWLEEENRIGILAVRYDPSNLSRIRADLVVGGVLVGTAQWIGVDADALLASGERWHVAAVLDAPNSLRLFVNGVQRGLDTTGILSLPTGTYTLLLGRYSPPFGGYDLDGILDEVRLSKVARYAANFPITRFQGGRRLGLRGPEIMATAGGIP